MIRAVWIFVALPLAAYALLCLVVACRQSSLVWFPGPPPAVTPAAAGLAYEEVALETEDGVRLGAWFLPAEEAAGVVLVSHGNAGNVAGRVPHAQAFLERGLAVLLYDYRGYGKSEGTPSEEGTYRDAEAAYDHLRARGFAPERIALYGESLGAGVAVELARRRRAACLVIESAFTSVPELGQRIYPFLPVKILARIRYDNRAKVAKLALPVMVVHSRGDELVPFELGWVLYEALRGPKAFLETRGGHNDGGFLQRQEWRAAVAEFVLGALPAGSDQAAEGRR